MRKMDLPKNVKKIIEILEKNGYEAYAVGGCVRDSLLGKEPKDWDITSSARPEQVKALFRRTIDTGIQHGTVTVMLDHVGYEVTTYRIDGEYEDGRHPKEVIFTASLREDLKRRDFTINAMAYSDRTGVVDEFEGIRDLENGVIRCVGLPQERFTEDALRILRALRFSAQLGFQVEENTMKAVMEMAPTLQKISRERIQAELEKLLMSAHPDRVMDLGDTGILPVVFTPEQPVTGLSLTDACRETSEILSRSPKNHYIRWAVFITCLPFRNILKSLKFDNKTIRTCNAMQKYAEEELQSEKSYLRHLAVRVGIDIFEDYYLPFREAMQNTDCEVLESVKQAYREILADGDCLSPKTLAVNGADLMQLGIPSGTQMGNILAELFELVLQDAKKNNKRELLEIAEKLFSS